MDAEKKSNSPRTIVGPALAAIPFVGGSLSAIWSQWDTSRRFERVELFIHEFGQKIVGLERKFDPSCLDDSHMQLLEEVLRRVQIEHRETKRQYFAELIFSAWTKNRKLSFEENMMFVRALEEFDQLHIEILLMLKEQYGKSYPSYIAIAEHFDIAEADRDKLLLPALSALASGYGFVKRAWGMSGGRNKIVSSNNLSVEGIARGGEHEITPTGIRFLESIVSGNSAGPSVG